MYIVKIKAPEGVFYMSHMNASGTRIQYDKDINKAIKHTREEAQYVKDSHIPSLGRWVIFENELQRISK